MSNFHLVALSYHVDHSDDLGPTEPELAQHEQTLSATYDNLIRRFLDNDSIDDATLRYISVLAALSTGHTASARAQDACKFYVALNVSFEGLGVRSIAADGAVRAATAGVSARKRARKTSRRKRGKSGKGN
jgi:hypothetical protein